MNDLFEAAGSLIFSPAAWMIIVSILLMKTSTQQLLNLSMPYTDGLYDFNAKSLRKHFSLNAAVSILSAAASLSLKISLSIETLIVFWILMLLIQVAKAMPASSFLAALATLIISRFINIYFVASDVLEIAMISQGLMAVLLLIDSPESYPTIAKQKDGSIKGVHNHYKTWFMPVFAYRFSLSSNGFQMLFMLFFILNNKFTKETYRSYKMRNGIFMLSMSVSAAIVAVIIKNHDAVIIASGIAALIWTVYEAIRAARAKELFLPAQNGVRVLYVHPGGKGDRAGILPGDIIISLNSRRIMNIGGIENYLSNSPPHLFIEVLRNNKILTLEFKDYQNGIDGLDCSYIPRKPVKYQLP